MDPRILQDLQKFYPEIVITATLLGVIIVDLALGSLRRSAAFILTGVGLTAAFVMTIRLFQAPAGYVFYDMLVVDNLGLFFKAFIILASFLVLLATPGSQEMAKRHLGEFYALLLGAVLGMMLLASSSDLLMIFLSLEMVSISSYVMVGYLRNERMSNEASLKYILFGTVSAGTMLYGFSLLFGITGTTKLAVIRQTLASAPGSENSLLLLVSCVMILAGFGFKIAAVPFHFWCPDVYTGAPTPVTAFLSVAPKAAGFAALVRFFLSSMTDAPVGGRWAPTGAVNWSTLLLVLSLVTMTLGNIAALRQENLKRMLAYSSIAHAGYILMGAVVVTGEGIQAVLVYLMTYLFMNLGAFFVVIEIYNCTGSFEMSSYRGFYRRSPFLTISMTLFMLSLMGIPPFAGFVGKLFVFAAAVHQNLAWFAVVGALNSVIAVYYYARVLKTMIIEPGDQATPIAVSWPNCLLLWAMIIPTMGLMLFWSRVQHLASESVRLFLGI